MNFAQTIRSFLTKSKRELTIYYVLFVVIFIAIFGIIIYAHYSALDQLAKKLSSVNKQRTQAQQLLVEHKTILAQQEAVKALLQQDPQFLIGTYFKNLLSSLNLQNMVTSGPTIHTESNASDGFIAQKLTTNFSHLNIKQLTELLEKLGQNERIETESLKVEKDVKDGLLNVTLTIVTLEPQQTSA